jgi:hypothetical protein
MLRKEHDALVTEIITRDGAGEIIKSTGDGLLAILFKPSIAVERAVEIQERLHGHPYIKVRIGMDMGEVSVELMPWASAMSSVATLTGRRERPISPTQGISASRERSTRTPRVGSERVVSPGRSTGPTA